MGEAKLSLARPPASRVAFGRPAIAGSLLLLAAFAAAWEWLPGLAGVPAFVIPPLSAVVVEAGRMLAAENVLLHTGITLSEVALGFALGSLLGMAVGYGLGMSPTAEVLLSPYILAMQIAPKVAFAPLFVMWFGYTIYPKILVAVLIVFFPVMINVLGAMHTLDRDMINLVRSFSATRLQLFWKLEFPASMPPLFSGLRIASTLAVIGVVVGEMVGGNTGLGYLLVFGEGQANTAMVFVTIMLLTLIGIAAYAAVVLAERAVLHYMPKRTLEQA